MSDVVIRVENLSKKYVIRHHRGPSSGDGLRHAMSDAVTAPLRWLRRAGRLKDAGSGQKRIPTPHLPTSPSDNGSRPATEEFYALRGVSFEVKRGEVLGVIGRNGAGKSTLLKILSRITEPTTGRIGIKGRVASLLEVGTGFHAELTGRENIFLNGAILGMTRAEVKRKFDQIVAFAEVEKFLDTPVKHYSSGMYVRLAFSVAAHLEPDILIVDEVLAVGDAQFQKKCMGKMQDVSGAGRTVLFVSHNMTAIRSLCDRALVVRNGKLAAEGAIEEMVHAYLSQDFCGSLERRWGNGAQAPRGGGFAVLEARLVPVSQTGSGRLSVESAFDLVFHIWSDKPTQTNLSLHFMTPSGEIGFAVASPCVDVFIGQTTFRCHVPGNFLNEGTYSVELLVVADSKAEVIVRDALTFEIDDRARSGAWMGKWPGFVRPQLNWEHEHMENDARS